MCQALCALVFYIMLKGTINPILHMKKLKLQAQNDILMSQAITSDSDVTSDSDADGQSWALLNCRTSSAFYLSHLVIFSLKEERAVFQLRL